MESSARRTARRGARSSRAPSPRSEPVARTLAAIALACALASPARADGVACAEAIADRVQHRYEAVKDLSAAFDQTTRVATLGSGAAAEPVEAKGTVVFAKPGRMRWAYAAPEESLVVSDGETLWIYDPAAKEVQRLAAGGGFLSGVAVQFLVGEGNLRRDFRVSARDCAAPDVTLTLVPKQDATYEKIELTAARESGEVRETRIFDLVGNVTTIRLHDLRTNLVPAASTFAFDPPAGVAVIELPESPQP
jgi:outer membrane lipoprotein carrier protein